MGCDIHLKLEMRQVRRSYMLIDKFEEDGIHKEIVETPYNSYSANWHSVRLTRGDCWGDRVYGMFAKLADVRNYFRKKINPIPQRGFPKDACDDTKSAYSYIVISDDEFDANKDYYEYSDTHYINESKANSWLKDGLSEEMQPFGNTDLRKITDPDAHSPNWCSTKEMEECIKEIFWNEEKQEWIGDYVEWFALLGAMKGVEYNGVYECRAVFWFDN